MPIRYLSGLSVDSTVLVVDAVNDRVGIGTASPNSILEISALTPVFRIQASDTANFHGIEFRQGAGFDAFIKQLPVSGEFRISNGRSVAWGGFITFYTDTVERLRITPAGNVGIGTTAPPIKLYVGTVLTGTNGNGTYASDAIAVNSSESITIGPDRRADWALDATTATSTTFQSKLNIWSDNEDHITFGGASTHLVSAWESFKIWINNDSADAGTLHLYHTSSKTEFVRLAGSGNSWINGGNVGIGTTSPSQKLDVSGNIMVLGLKNTDNYFEKILGDVSFTNGDANKAFNIILGNSGVWGYIEVEVNSTYNNQSSAGKLTKRFAIGTNPNNLIYINESRVSDAMGTIVNNIAIGEFAWDGAISSYVIPISHIVSSGNAYNVRVRCYSTDGGASTVFAALSLSAVYTLTALARQYPYYNDRLGIGTTSPAYKLDVAGTGAFSGNVAINGTFIGTDQTFGGAYRTFAFGVNSNGYNRIFAANDATDGLYLNAATGQGINFRVNGGGANVLVVASTGAATFSSSVEATSFIKTSGTSSQFLKADGSVDSSTYLTANQTITLSGVVTGSGTTAITTAIANGAITNAMLANSSFFVGTTSIDLGRASAAQTLTGVSIDGNAATATEVSRTVTAGTEANLVSATIGDNDFFRIRTGGASNAGFVEIATADDGTEPIYVRQYTGVFATLTRTATLLDGSGNTSFPGSVTASSLIKSGGTSAQYLMADGSVSTLTNPVTGTGTTNYVTKWTSGSAIGDSIIYDNGTNLGIGTTTPYGGTGVRSITVNAASYPTLALKVGDVFKGGIFGYSDHIDLYSEGYLNFETSGTEKMRIDTSGNLGIGTTSPTQKLEVNGVIESPYLEFKPVVFYDFNSDTTGDWSKGNSTLSVPNDSVTRYTSTGNDSNISKTFDFDGGQNQIIRIHYKVVTGPSGGGEIFYANSQHGFSASYFKGFTLVSDGAWHTLVLDMSNLNAGGTDWIDYNVTQIRFDLTNVTGVVIDIDWIAIGGNGYGTQYFENDVAFMNGNVGIGTTSPGAKLHNYSTATSNVFISGYGTAAQNDWGGGHAFFVNANNGIIIGKANAQNDTNRLYTFYNDAAGNAEQYIYNTSNTATIKLDSAGDTYFNGGNVGIGTTAPASILHVSSTGANAYSSTITKGSNMKGIVNTSSNNANDMIGIYFATGTAEGAHWSGITGSRSNAPTDWGTQLNFYTHDDNLSNINDATQKMVIKGSGNVGIGTTSPGALLDVGGGDGTPNGTQFTSVVKGTSTRTMYFDGGGSSGASVWWGDGNTPQFAIDSVSGGGAAMWVHASSAWYRIVDVAANGNVGINQTSPQQKLDVFGNISLGSWTKPGSTYVGLRRADDGSFGGGGDSGLVIESYNHAAPYNGDYSQRVHLRTHLYNGGSHNVLTAYGTNVGIGTTSPTNKVTIKGETLSVGSEASYALHISNGTKPVTIGSDNNYGYIQTFSSAPLSINSQGNNVIFPNSTTQVGIGTASPGELLDLRRDTNTGSVIRVRNANGGTADYAGLALGNDLSANGGGIIIFGSQSTYSSPYNPDGTYIYSNRPGGISITSETAAPVYIATSNSIRLYVASAGNVGIGTTAPPVKLRVQSSGSTFTTPDNNDVATISIYNSNNSSATAHAIISMRTQVSGGSPFISFDVENEAGYSVGMDNASNQFRIAYGWNSLTTYPGLVLTPATSPNVLIGTTTDSGYKLRVNGTSYFDGLAHFAQTATTGSAFRWGSFGTAVSPDTMLCMNQLWNGSGWTILDANYGTTAINLGSAAASPTIRFETGGANTSATTKMIILNNGNVGIGTTAPGEILEASRSTNGDIAIKVTNSNTGSSAAAQFFASNGTNQTQFFHTGTSYTGSGVLTSAAGLGGLYNATVQGLAFLAANASGAIKFATGTGNDERMRITSAGNVGIGITAPIEKLHVTGNAHVQAATDTVGGGGYYLGGSTSRNLAIRETATGNNFAFDTYNGTTSWVNRVTILNSNGNVGIGTTAPSAYLDVKGLSDTAGVISLQLRSGNTSGNFNSNQITLGYANTADYRHAIKSRHNSGAGAGNAIDFYIWNNSLNASDIATNHVMSIDTTSVGIGTTVPTEKLHVDGSTLITYNNSFQSTNSVGNKAILARVSPTSGIVNYAEYATATNLNGFVIGSDDARVKGNIATDSLEFITNTSTRMTVLSSGNVGINTTVPGSTLHVVGDVLIQTGALGVGVNPNATDGRIDASNDIVAFSTSDRRLKENITPIANALEKVRSLTGVEFDWKEETKSVHGYEGHDVGVIAQDVQAVLPEAVRTNDSGYLSVRYEKMIALLVEAMKEQQAQIDELKAQINDSSR